MKKYNDGPILALFIIRIAVGLFFLTTGIPKLVDPAAFSEMLKSLFDFDGTTLIFMTWLVIFAEFLGGLIIILGILVPSWLYRLALFAVFCVVFVGYAATRSGDMMPFLWHAFLGLVLVGLFQDSPRCPGGITGKRLL